MKIYIGADHTGFEVKEEFKVFLENLGCAVEDKGFSDLMRLMIILILSFPLLCRG